MGVGSIVPGTDGERTGARTLNLLAAPLNAEIIERLAEGPRRLVELRRATGCPQTTLRTHLRELVQVGAIAKRRLHPFPSVREYVLTNRPGIELRFVATILAAWLADAPPGRLELGSESGRVAVKALAEGWSSTMLRPLAEGGATLAELDGAIGTHSQQAIERRLAALNAAGLVRRSSGDGRSARYEVTEWLRRGIAPLAAAVRWERKHLAEVTTPIGPIDAETGLLLAVPLLEPAPELSGSCRLGVDFVDGSERRLAGVTVEVEGGRVTSWTARLDGNPSAWATGPPPAWLRVAIQADPKSLELGGDERLALGLLDALNRALFPPVGRARPHGIG